MADERGGERAADPLSDVVGLVRPRAVVGKEVSGAGRWALQFAANEAIDFAIVTAGRCHHDGPAGPLELRTGDFLLLCAPPAFRFGDHPESPALDGDAAAAASGRGAVLRLGNRTAETCRLLAGHFYLQGDNAGFVVRMLPSIVVVRAGDESGRRLQHLLMLLAEEVSQSRPGRELVLARLAEVVLIEALRWSDDAPAGRTPPPGFVRGLADPVVGAALVALHAGVSQPWTVARLAAEVGVSRSVLADRFPGTVGVPPMTYLLHWRIALARQALAEGGASLAEVAQAVGFGSASALSAAFLRVTGVRPGRWARERRGRTGRGDPDSGALKPE